MLWLTIVSFADMALLLYCCYCYCHCHCHCHCHSIPPSPPPLCRLCTQRTQFTKISFPQNNRMSETKDPAFKLFGKTIAVPPEEITASLDDHQPQEDDDDHDEMDTSNKRNENKERDQANQTVEDLTERARSSRINENSLKASSMDKEITATKATKPEEEQSETSITKEKTIKKPDKILPCPRCNSLDTKFCYYNNYNVNQPRHFCKNCQRYWTAGGTMRNVPVGAGRRKNKNSTSHYRQITVPEALRTNTSESIHNPSLRPSGNVLNFGLEVPLCESMASIFNLTEKTMQNCHRNGFHITEEARIPVSLGGGENGEELSSGSPVVASNSREDAKFSTLQEPAKQNCHGFPPQIPYFAGAPWNHPWNSAQWGSPVSPPPALLPPPPSFCSSSFPVPFYPAVPYWGCPMPGTWSIPWSSPLSSSPNTVSLGSGSNCPNLGKHSREGNTCDPENVDTSKQSSSERGILIPKTLRIDDPDEAAKSSIWATLGIKNDKADGMKAGGLFKAAFHSKTDEKDHPVDTSQVLHANPAALSRSLNFHERS